ncbi:MAG: glycosyltransferase family 4 protein [bacterium]
MKIAIYSGNIPSTVFIENLIEGLALEGFEIYLFGKQTHRVKYNGKVKIIPTPVSAINLIAFVLKESLKLLFSDPKLFIDCSKKMWIKNRKFKNFFKEMGVLLPVLNNKPDVFHIQWAKTVEQYPEIFDLLDCKFAVSLRGAHINYSPLTDINLGNAYKKYFPKIDGFHAVSNAIGSEAEKYGADKKKITVIHSSVREELLQKESIPYQSNQTLEVLSIGRFHWKKGYHYALDSINILNNNGVDIKYTIIAQGEVPEEILFMINDFDIKDKVQIIKGLSYDNLIEKLQECHLLLLPSVEEGIANVVLEAMAVGVPVITTDCGGMNEVVNDKANGYIVPVRNPEAIVKKVKEFIETDFEFKSKMIVNAKETIKNEFSRMKQVKEFSEFYRLLVN